MIRGFLFLLLCADLLSADEVTLLHFSDYHSHALPFYSEDRKDQGGIAHAIGYVEREKKAGAIIFSGGDMINKGSPAWSDKYGCAEWPWLNGIVDAMAYGNHDSDYGPEAFASCRARLTYPILAANVTDADGKRIFDHDGKPYLVLERNGRRIGIFATVGRDFDKLIAAPLRPVAGAEFTDRVESARDVVRSLREIEKVDAVIMIGHAHREDDEALARAVSGIDLIFGTHSHLKAQMQRIDGTDTWFLAPYQYLTYVSKATLHFDEGKLRITGALVPIDTRVTPSATVADKVESMQKELERDPLYAELFGTIGHSPRALSIAGQNEAQTEAAGFIMEVVRKAAGADLAISTTSSFRSAIPAGKLTFEDLRATLPYPNRVLVYELTGAEVRALLALSESKRGSDAFGQITRVPKLHDKQIYKVATTDYLARVAPGYREFLAAKPVKETPHEVRDLVRRHIEANWK
jgi:5'-nucleotidase / UDP-sugar diphosphatase